ncbi:MAG TPA: hypothetical protein VF753_21455 [Terriglobales bacterium]
MNGVQPSAAAATKQPVGVPPAVRPTQNSAAVAPTAQAAVEAPAPKPVGYGLPCAKCRTYYAANLKACPICRSSERLSPTVRPVRSAVAVSEQNLPDPEALEQERERFLKEFQAKMLASHPAAPVAAAATAKCERGENHPNGPEPAAVCQGCYEQLQEKVDVLEAAMHIELKEATQIIYDAVWAEPTDPAKTYQNAAAALLAELRKRSGVTPTFHAQMPMLD